MNESLARQLRAVRPQAGATPAAMPQDTRERILMAAERLFMENGFDGTSMRMITGQAKVNLAAVNYHFETKEALLRAVLDRRLTALNDHRLRALEEMEQRAGGKALRPSQIVDAYFGTLMRMGKDGSHGGTVFLRLLGRIFNEPSKLIRDILEQQHGEILERFQSAFLRAMPQVPREEIAWRFHFMQGAMAYAIAGIDPMNLFLDWSPGQSAPATATATATPAQRARVVQDETERLYPRLMSFLLGGLRAPLPSFKSESTSGD